MNKRLLAAVAVGLVAMSASGCSRIRDNQGYIADPVLLSSIQPGVDNRQSVMQTLGRPSFEGGFDGQQWYYVSRSTGQLAFLKPKPTTQNILVVSFDQKGNVSKVEKRGLEQAVSIDPVGDKTPTLGRESGILQDLFGNIGRVGSMGGTGGAPQ